MGLLSKLMGLLSKLFPPKTQRPVSLSFIQSKGEGKRLIQGGGVKFEGEKISEPTFLVENAGIIQAGKRKFVKIVR